MRKIYKFLGCLSAAAIALAWLCASTASASLLIVAYPTLIQGDFLEVPICSFLLSVTLYGFHRFLRELRSSRDATFFEG